jgi:hypothetical protein
VPLPLSCGGWVPQPPLPAGTASVTIQRDIRQSRSRPDFLKVPEGKTVKNRLHLDLRPADQGAEVARLQALGARQVSIGQGDVSWVVMADPDGNEFDVLQPLTPAELPPGHDALGHRIAAGDGEGADQIQEFTKHFR